MTRAQAIQWLKFLQEEEHNKADSAVPCTTEVALGVAIEALEQPKVIRCKNCANYYVCNIKPFDGDDWFCGSGIPNTEKPRRGLVL